MLDTILPKEKLKSFFDEDLIFEEYHREDIDKIAELTPSTCSQVGMSIWNEIVQKKLHPVDPQAIAKYVQKEDPKLHKKIANILGKTVVFGMYYATAKIDSNDFDTKLVCELFVAHIYPQTLYLADILFQNPKKRIPKDQQKFQHQKYEGFGLLPDVISKLEEVAKVLDCNQISLTAAAKDQVPLFEKYNFHVQDSEMGKIALEYGLGIPMEKSI